MPSPHLWRRAASDIPNRLDQRIDLVLVRGRAEPERAFLTGQGEEDRTAAGLWHSDYGGVVETLDFGRRSRAGPGVWNEVITIDIL